MLLSRSTPQPPADLVPLPAGALTVASDATHVAAAFRVRYAGRTRTEYTKALQGWAAWCAAHDLDLLAVTRSHLELWLRELEDDDIAPAARAQRLAAVAGYYETAVEEEVLTRNPAARVRRPTVGKDSQRLGPDKDEGYALLAAAQEAGGRDHALICLLLLSRLRISEALGLTREALRCERGHRVARIRRKGGAYQDVVLSPRTTEAVDALIASCGELASGEPLFVDGECARLDVFDAGRIVRRLTRRAELRKHFSPHSLRHGFVTAALDAGVPLRRVQDAAGHADPRTTRRYDRARNALDRHPAYAVAGYFAQRSGRGYSVIYVE